jgi:outer membrane murein-binding lipoprotein Lpp
MRSADIVSEWAKQRNLKGWYIGGCSDREETEQLRAKVKELEAEVAECKASMDLLGIVARKKIWASWEAERTARQQMLIRSAKVVNDLLYVMRTNNFEFCSMDAYKAGDNYLENLFTTASLLGLIPEDLHSAVAF